jgi:hypothetical protein
MGWSRVCFAKIPFVMASSRKLATGKVTKRADCAGCGRSYEYDLARTVMGASSKDAPTQAEADAQATQAADAKLAAALANDCDLAPCPSCGAVTKEMKAYRRKRFGAAFLCMGGGAGILLVVFLLMLFLHKIYFVMAGMGALCFLLGFAVLSIAIKEAVLPKKGRL